MRGLHLLLALGVALAAAGCARQPQQAYYVIDPQTGQPVPVVAQQQQPYAPLQYPQASGAQPQYAQQAYAPQAYAPQPQVPQSNDRGLFSASPASAQQSYAQTSYQQPAYQQPAPQAAPSSGRGLFNSRASAPAYSQQPAYQPQYAAPQYGAGGPYVAAPANSYAAVAPTAQPAYTLDSGDKLRIVVFGQDGITNSYIVGADGNVNLPLVGSVPARGFATQQLSQMISERLKQGYVREPHVSVEVETYRPFFILGEVTTPGQYSYVANMTAETAVAIAGGFSPRADKRTVEITRNAPDQQFRGSVPLAYPLRPGDTIVVKERWF
ncbi:MAG TPA: polysaccharide biosynthesis/export family protein [Pseudolabrys sp.]|nr:polysaccharide biosynthesis/export family protein [Pseudolabrys sp.]